MPLCPYETWYTVTLIEKASPALADLEFDQMLEGENVGLPELVTLDLAAGKIFISAIDETLVDRTWQAFVNCHVAVNATIQGPYSSYMPPFDI